MEEEKGIVCVTGGAGCVASWLIMRLLQHGYSVRATVRSDPMFKEDTSHLLNLPEAPEKLQIFDADLENPESFEAAINGCIGVFHLSHPMDFEGKIPLDTLIKTSIEGTLGILKACLKSKTVKRVVYTSSISAAMCISNMNETGQIDESMWSDLDMVRSHNFPAVSYIVSKTLTESAVLEFSKEHGLDVVTILPSAIAGPFLTSYLPVAFSQSLPLIFGKEVQLINMTNTNLVHIDDVASAQIFLFECPIAEGRHICSTIDLSIHGLAKLLSNKYPELELQIPTDDLSKMEETKPLHLSSKKLLNLGFKFKYDLEEMFDGTIQCCKEKGFL